MDIPTIFKKPPALESMRKHLDKLVAKHEAAKKAVVERQNRIAQLHLAEDVDLELLTKEKLALASDEMDVFGLTNAIKRQEETIAAEATAVAAAVDRKLREQSAKELRTGATQIGSAVATISEGLASLASATDGVVASAISDARGLNLLAKQLGKEIPTCAAVIQTMIRQHVEAVLAGRARPTVSKPAVAPVPARPPIPTRMVASLAELQWREGDEIKTGAKFAKVHLPLVIADKAVRLRHAVEPDSAHAKSLNRGHGPMNITPPGPGPHCIDLDDPNLAPATPVFGPRDTAAVASGLKVVLGATKCRTRFSARPDGRGVLVTRGPLRLSAPRRHSTPRPAASLPRCRGVHRLAVTSALRS
jgi:hypothetical protein